AESCRGTDGAPDSGDVAEELAEVLQQRPPPSARTGRRPADLVVTTSGRVGQPQRQPPTVGEAMRDDQADPRPSVGERQHREMPPRPMFGIEGCVPLIAQPGLEFRTWAGYRHDFDVLGPTGCDPAMAAERQRRLLDATRESPLRQMAVKAPQTVH